jgi:hypothetical protein
MTGSQPARAGTIYAYLSEVQADHLEMPKSDAFKAIVDRAVELSKPET